MPDTTVEIRPHGWRRLLLDRGESVCLLIAVVMLVCIALFTTLDWLAVQKIRKEALAAQNMLRHANAFLLAVADAETGQRGFLLTGRIEYLAPYDQGKKDLAAELQFLDQATADDPAGHDRVSRLRELTEAKVAELTETIELRKRGDMQGSMALMMNNTGKNLMDAIRQFVSRIVREQGDVFAARVIRNKGRFDRAHFIGVFSCVVLMVILGLGARNVAQASARREQLLAERKSLIVNLEAALAAKTILVKEVHHRVKNNLAVIVALLNMQCESVADETARTSLLESQRRVSSMALIHEQLYSGRDLDRVNFGEYARQLATELLASYPIEPGSVSIAVQADDVELPMDRAIPCGLILNELLSNAVKYAYPRGQKGAIRVHFVRVGTGQLSLSCRDSGAGIPETLDWRNAPSLGLHIIQILAKQLGGELSLDRSEGGTRFELLFSE